jgi:hypothetical protein
MILLQKARPFKDRNRATMANSIKVTLRSFQLLVNLVLKISVDGLRKLNKWVKYFVIATKTYLELLILLNVWKNSAYGRDLRIRTFLASMSD